MREGQCKEKAVKDISSKYVSHSGTMGSKETREVESKIGEREKS